MGYTVSGRTQYWVSETYETLSMKASSIICYGTYVAPIISLGIEWILLPYDSVFL